MSEANLAETFTSASAFSFNQNENRSPRKFIIDTDTGVDDAIAIFMALEAHRRSDIEILAITLVAGVTQVEKQKTNILRILKLVPECLGKIPVYVGAHESLVRNYIQAAEFKTHGDDGFCDVTFPDDPLEELEHLVIKEEHAAIAIARLANKYPDQVTVVSLGPLTNIALAIKLSNNLVRQINHFYIMGGTMNGIGTVTATAETNFYSDPESAFVLMKKLEEVGKVKSTIVPIEVCQDNFMSWKWRHEVLSQVGGERIKLLNQLDDARRKILNTKDEWRSCDMFAMAIALNPRCIKKSSVFTGGVELHGSQTRGMLVLDKRQFLDDDDFSEDKSFNVEVVEEFDIELIKSLLIHHIQS